MPASGARSVLLPSVIVLLAATSHPARADEVAIEVEETPPASPPPAAPPAPDPAVQALTAELTAVRARLETLEAAQAAAAEAPPPPEPPPPPPTPWTQVLDLKIWGYVQPQVVWNQTSKDELDANGSALNKDAFQVRRGRIEVERFWRYAYSSIEVDLNTVGGPRVSLAGAEIAGLYPGRKGAPPLVRVGLGLADMDFGFELGQDANERHFMERTLGSRAFFAGDSDIGVRVSGGLGPLRYHVAGVNGVPISPDVDTAVYAHQKTVVGRVGFDTRRPQVLEVRGGVSYLAGTGFHEGTPASKSTLQWSDVNQDGVVTLNELNGVNAQTATPSSVFPRWGVNADLAVGVHTPLGWTWVQGEATVASNLDRNWFAADPVAAGYDLRELAWNVAALQDVTPYGIVGFRADGYQPDADLFESRRGLFLPTDASVLTLSPLVGLRVPGLARFYVQYDYVVDFLGRDVRGEPVDLPNDQWTVRGQVEF